MNESSVTLLFKVEARFGGRGKYYSGVIKAANGDGTYEIRYNDGDTEKAVREELIRSRAGGADAGTRSEGSEGVGEVPRVASFVAGEAVEARFGGRGKYYSGVIKAANGDGTYEIRYNDGDTEKAVREELIRSRADADSAPKKEFRGSRVAALEDGSDDVGTLVMHSNDATGGIFAAARSTFSLDINDGSGGGEARSSDNNVDPRHRESSVTEKAALISRNVTRDGTGGMARGYSAPSAEVCGETSREAPVHSGSTLTGTGGSDITRWGASYKDEAGEIGGSQSTEAVTTEAQAGAQETVLRLEPTLAHFGTENVAEEAQTESQASVPSEPSPKLQRALSKLVLLREAPTRWDRHRAAIMRGYAAEAIARADHVRALEQRVKRLEAAAAETAGAARTPAAPPAPPHLAQRARAASHSRPGAAAGGRTSAGCLAGSSAHGLMVRFLRAECNLSEMGESIPHSASSSSGSRCIKK